MTLLKKYVSLSQQAENLDTREAYKELIDTIREMPYEELYNLMSDSETMLKVLVRKEAKGNSGGLRVLSEAIRNLANAYIEQESPTPRPKLYLGYTYEFIDKEEAKKREVET